MPTVLGLNPRAKPSTDDILKGVCAGILGGVVGAGVKLLGELVFPPRMPGEPIPPAVMASRLVAYFSGCALLPNKELLAIQLFHWTFSASVSALYGGLAERLPRVTFGRGVAFGLVLCLATHETLLPAAGFSLPWAKIPLKEHLSELTTHALFGLAVEMTRRFVRRHLSSIGQASAV